MFDALELETKPFRMEIMDPVKGTPMADKDGKVAYVDLISTESPEAESWRRGVFDRNQLAMKKRRNVAGQTFDENKAQGVELLVTLTVGWYLVDKAGKPIDAPFSKETARQLYNNPKMSWLKQQVDDALGNDANFIAA